MPPEVKAPANPWAQYGLNPDGTPLDAGDGGEGGEGKPKEGEGGEGGEGKKPPTDPRDTKIADLETKLNAANEKLSKLPSDFEGMGKKFEIIDKLMKAFAGDDDPNAKISARVWSDIKQIAPAGVRKAMEILEKDPEALDRLTGSVDSLHVGRLADINVKAHQHVVGLAKKAFPVKGLTNSEVNELVFPFERAMTDIINSNKTLRERFSAGDLGVVEELFTRLAKPHVQGRLKEKQARMDRSSPAPKAPPKGAGGPGAGDDKSDKKPDLKTPKGRAQFHREAVGRFLAKRAAASDEE